MLREHDPFAGFPPTEMKFGKEPKREETPDNFEIGGDARKDLNSRLQSIGTAGLDTLQKVMDDKKSGNTQEITDLIKKYNDAFEKKSYDELPPIAKALNRIWDDWDPTD